MAALKKFNPTFWLYDKSGLDVGMVEFAVGIQQIPVYGSIPVLCFKSPLLNVLSDPSILDQIKEGQIFQLLEDEDIPELTEAFKIVWEYLNGMDTNNETKFMYLSVDDGYKAIEYFKYFEIPVSDSTYRDWIRTLVSRLRPKRGFAGIINEIELREVEKKINISEKLLDLAKGDEQLEPIIREIPGYYGKYIAEYHSMVKK